MLAVIPLRGGSKGIPKKNIKMLAGKPLCQWAIEAAKEAAFFDRILVSTDSMEIADTVHKWNGTNVDVRMRPKNLAKDDTPTEAVMLDIAKTEPFGIMCLIQATCPLTLPSDLLAARAKFYSWGVDSLLTVTELKKFVWKPEIPTGNESIGIVRPVNYIPRARPMRDGIESLFIETGNFYMTKKWVLEEEHSRLGGNVGRYIMPKERAVDIDDLRDFAEAEFYLRGRVK